MSRNNRSTKEDEDLARRLQFEEQSRPAHSINMSRSRYSQQELQDMELARQYAQMDLDPTGQPPPSYLCSRREEDDQRMTRRSVSNHDRTSSPTPQSGGQFYYGSSASSPRRYSAASPSPGNREHQQFESPGHRRRNTAAVLLSPRTSGHDPFDYSRRRSAETDTQRLQASYAERRLSRSQSPTNVPPRLAMSVRGLRPAFSDLSGSQPGHQRSPSYGKDHEFLVRGGGVYDEAAVRERRYTEETSLPQSAQLRHDTCTQLDYARQLQLQAYSDLQRGGLMGSTRLSEEDEDLELARKMQDLEDRGMGRLNSDREIEVVVDSDEGSRDGGYTSQGHLKSKRPTGKEELNENEELTRLISESGTSFNDISDEVLRELLGSTAAKQLKLAASDPTQAPKGGLGSSLHVNSPSIISLRAALSGVDPAEIERRATRLARADGPAILSAKILKLPSSAPTSPVKMSESAPEKPATKMPASVAEASLSTSPTKKKKRRGFLSFAARTSSRDNLGDGTKKALGVPSLDDRKPLAKIPGVGGIPAAIPPPPGGSLSIRSVASTRQSRSVSPARAAAGGGPPSGIPGGIRPKPTGGNHVMNNSFNGSFRGTSVCAACGLTHGTFLKAFDRTYHPECFRCSSCNGKIDPNDQFKYTTDDHGRKHPHHRECFMSFGVQCCVCRQTIPATPDGRVPFIKHPFFDSEQMCVRHAEEQHRRCSGCQRFEPNDGTFIDLMDGDRCVCPACCRSVVVDSADAKPLWRNVIAFFENHLKLPVWKPMRDIPILLVGSESLNEQMQKQNNIHGSSIHPMTSGLCLTEHGRSSASSSNVARYNGATSPNAEVFAILCLSGLPRDLTASVLAHEAAHAWIKLHPKYDANKPLPPQVEEGVCQLIAMLFLSDGLASASVQPPGSAADGPSDEKLRQYFKFTIEREKNEIYGTGYRRAAMAYRDIGIEALLTYVLQCNDFPLT
jgi:Protein DA1/LIM domain